MITLSDVDKAAGATNLEVFGAFHPKGGDGAPEGTKTLVLLGPKEPGFWRAIQHSEEWQDGGPDPIDRWSTRVISELGETLGATALFPFGDPPYQPFISWALKSGRAWTSPVGILVHDRAGLMVSYRGALAFEDALENPTTAKAPCESCATRDCLSACPASAMSADGYDVPLCHRFLDTSEGQECLGSGCIVRRSCPISQTYGRLPEQSAYHMSLFHK